MSQLTPLQAFLHWESTAPDRVFLRQPVAGIWYDYTYRDAGNQMRRLASFFKRTLPAKSKVAILSKNCAEWIIADLAVMMANHVSVPIYPTLSADSIAMQLTHSESKLIIIGKLDVFERQRSAIPGGMAVVSFDRYGIHEGITLTEILKSEEEVQLHPPIASDLATIMYSSGTTGNSKGVMLTHGALGYVGERVATHLAITHPERFFSYLPLSHIAERALMEMVAIASGSTISFAESLDKFAENLAQEKPTIFGGVPRIYTKFREGVLKKISQKKLDTLLSLPIIKNVLKKSIARKLGLAEARVIVSGAAPTPVSLLEWFSKLGIDVREMYGMTENTAFSHSNFNENKRGTVGQPWPDVECKISDDGEILIRHKALMTGYYKDPDATAAAFDEDGFLRTGDKGFRDDKRFLTITGRVKDQFKTDKGKFISPAHLELKLLSNQNIEQACVVGMGLPQPIALVVLESGSAELSFEDLTTNLEGTLQEVNDSVEKHERIEKVVIMKHGWTIENGMLTPSLKLKRNELEKRCAPCYANWYAQPQRIIREE